MIKRKKSLDENKFEINLGFLWYLKENKLIGYWRNYNTELQFFGLSVYKSAVEKYENCF